MNHFHGFQTFSINNLGLSGSIHSMSASWHLTLIISGHRVGKGLLNLEFLMKFAKDYLDIFEAHPVVVAFLKSPWCL